MRASVTMAGLDEFGRDVDRAKRESRRGVENALRRELLRTSRNVQIRYRSKTEPGPGGTTVKSNTLRPSYMTEVNANPTTFDIDGKVGLFGIGELPYYFKLWEGQIPGKEGRPRGGALETERKDTQRRIDAAVDRAIKAAWG